MLASSLFLQLFPPPAFLLMPHAGLDISDDAIRTLAYKGLDRSRRLSLHGAVDLPAGLIEGGDVKDEKEFISRLTDFSRAHGLRHVKVSVPEEKSYLFQTEVPAAEFVAIEQNIEFKLEENVPLSAADALFYFDLIPSMKASDPLRATVSVVPRAYIEHYIGLLGRAGLSAVAFEVVPKSIARAVVPHGTNDTKLIIHVMNRKTGIYVVSGGIVNFASTVGEGGAETDEARRAQAAASLVKEIARVHAYWATHGTGKPIDEVLIVGRNAEAFEGPLSRAEYETPHTIRVADIWRNAFAVERHLPPVSRTESLEYAVAAGLAFDLSLL